MAEVIIIKSTRYALMIQFPIYFILYILSFEVNIFLSIFHLVVGIFWSLDKVLNKKNVWKK